MYFRIADTFTDSLGRLTGDEQKAVKTTAFDLQLNPVNPGMSFHRLDRARDKNFWSVRVNSDVRLIVHRTDDSLLLCYVDHHDKAYAWAERRRLETHPQTGAAQWVEIRERVQEIVVPVYVTEERSAPVPSATPPRPLFAGLPDSELLGYGVPPDWLGEVKAATDESLLALAEFLPAEAAEALLQLATGGKPEIIHEMALPPASPFDHPDAQRRFRVVTNVEELARALDYPWDQWTIFLHPAQRQLVESDLSGPARVAGSAGTGKTIVALHRAVHLARRHPDSRVLLTTFSEILADALRIRLRRLIAHEPSLAERLEVEAWPALGERLYTRRFGRPRLIEPVQLLELLEQAAASLNVTKYSSAFLLAEWQELVDAFALRTWETYRDVKRLGRKIRLPEAQRAVLWSVFERVWQQLDEDGSITRAGLFHRLAESGAGTDRPPFEFVVVDEAQDLGVAQLRYLAAIGATIPNRLFFAGDLGQRIFQQPFSWLSLGIDIRGRARTLHINYRTSHQIRRQADRLLDGEVADIDGNVESRRGTVSVFNGPKPQISIARDPTEECQRVAEFLAKHAADMPGHEIGIFVRSEAELPRARAAADSAGLPFAELGQKVAIPSGRVAICTMHLAKGLEFRAVVAMACDDEVIPLQKRIEAVGDEADLDEVYQTERHLLYVACTRAREHLLVTGVTPASEFLKDLLGPA